jgi:DNA polymerase-3 subunit delta
VNTAELERELAARGPRRAYLLAGGESLLRDDALTALRRAALGDGDPTFNFDRLEGAGATAAALLDALQTLPVFSARRLVVLVEPESRRGGARPLVDALAQWVGDPREGDTSVLVVIAARPDRRARWVRAFGDAVVACEAPGQAREIAAFVRAEAERQGIALARGAAEALAERIGPQLQMIRTELTKLALLAGPGEPVTAAQVGIGTAVSAEEPIWDLTDAIGEGRPADALRVLSRLIASGEAPPVLLGALVSHFRRLLRTAAGGDVAGPPFVRRKLASQAKRYGVARLRAALDALHETDLALKGAGALRPELALERVVISLAV